MIYPTLKWLVTNKTNPEFGSMLFLTDAQSKLYTSAVFIQYPYSENERAEGISCIPLLQYPPLLLWHPLHIYALPSTLPR